MKCSLTGWYRGAKHTAESWWGYVSSFTHSMSRHRESIPHDEGSMGSFMNTVLHIMKQVFLLLAYMILLGLTVAVAASVLYLLIIVVWRALLFVSHSVHRLFRRSDSFSSDEAMGLSSKSFDLSENIERQDSRRGLEPLAKFRVWIYMLWYRESFDEARNRYVQNKFVYHNISEDGRPRDPKAVFFDS